MEAVAALLSVPTRLLKFHQHRIAILVPAHNEEVCLEATLGTVLPQLRTQDRLIVIADNCTDSTAEIARGIGATVIERQNLTEIGKGYALDYGLQFLEADPPDVVIFVDADCAVQPGAIEHLAHQAWETGRPTQATYLLEKPPVPSPKDAISAFAFTVKNLVRPLGLLQMGFPCLLTGTGMAFPWAAIRSVSLASGHLAEDMKLSVDLTIAGYAPIYCPEARVIGHLPQQEKAARSQRTRWEHGHLQAILTYAPQLVKVAFQKRRPEALALALELCVPPLSLFVLLWLALSIVTLGWGFMTTAWIPAGLTALAGLFLVASILFAWAKFGRVDLPLHQLLSIPFYMLWKVPLYFKFLVRPESSWVRTERDALPPSETKALPKNLKLLDD